MRRHDAMVSPLEDTGVEKTVEGKYRAAEQHVPEPTCDRDDKKDRADEYVQRGQFYDVAGVFFFADYRAPSAKSTVADVYEYCAASAHHRGRPESRCIPASLARNAGSRRTCSPLPSLPSPDSTARTREAS